MIFDIVTIFPHFFESPFSFGIFKKAQDKGLIKINTHDLRNFTVHKHRKVDDKTYGGGSGMVLKPEPIAKAIESIKKDQLNSVVILTSPKGESFSDRVAKELSNYEQIIIICGRYEGIDERIRKYYVDKEISIGEYVISGGEHAASIIIDAVSRLIPGVLGNEFSAHDESFSQGLLEYPQYTRPESFRGKKVPQILLKGNHKQIENWRRLESIKATFYRNPYLLDRAKLSLEEIDFVDQIKKELPSRPKLYIALVHYPVYNKAFKTITTAFTNLDVHDISRVCKTYGVKCFFLIQPVEEQQHLIERVLDHWIKGPGESFNPSRAEALKLVSIKDNIQDTIEEIQMIEGMKPKIVVTDARSKNEMIGYQELREKIFKGNEPYLILFGTGWGIVKEVLEDADFFLKPIKGYTDYNHLSVRSAASIIIDRLLSCYI